MSSIRHALPLIGLLACTPSEPMPTPASEPIFVEEMPAERSRSLGPLLGGTVVERSPQLGRWAASMDFAQHRFITMEHTVSNHITGSVVLRLDPGGRASACVLASEASASAVGHLQADDGKDHHDESDHTVLVGMDSPRASSWAQRFDPSGHGEAPAAAGPAGPWLLLGIDPGLALHRRDHDRDAEPLTITQSEVRDPVASDARPR